MQDVTPKYLFLDVDGVLNTWCSRSNFGIDQIDDGGVALLAAIVKATGCQIVLSSTWRILKENRGLVREALRTYGLNFIDCTPRSWQGSNRGLEISKWLDEKSGGGMVAILDDDPLAEINREGVRFFRTYDAVGITPEIANEIISYFNLTNAKAGV